MIEYDHSCNLHTLTGALAAIPVLFSGHKPISLLDVGCGTGFWIKAALEFGIADVFGIDGLDELSNRANIPVGKFRAVDLNEPWHLGRRFDAELCLEVAEHLPAVTAPRLIDALVEHSDLIFFSAACPGQPGQNHIHCQWPQYWQQLFNAKGFSCDDHMRWEIWNDSRIEPWYRQNLFCARREPAIAGTEPRIPGVMHPELLGVIHSQLGPYTFAKHAEQIAEGAMPAGWYATVPLRALRAKLSRRITPRQD